MNLRDRILRLWEDGAKSGEIADELGITRNRVMGIVHRSQKKGDAHVRAPLKKKKPKKQIKDLPTRAIVTFFQESEKCVDKSAYVEIIPIEELAPRDERFDGPKTLLELGKYDCRWMLDEETYCGNETSHGHSWCPTHKGLVFSGANNDSDKPTDAS